MKRQKLPQRVIFVRHAESLRNEAKKEAIYFADDEARSRIKGVPDHKIGLTDAGHEHARRTSKMLLERFGVPAAFYDSGYLRTVQTREGLLTAYSKKDRKHITVRSSLFIRERDSGYTYDMTKEEAEKLFPFMEEYWETHGGFFARPIGGESLADVTNRVDRFLRSMFRKHAGKTIFIATHSGTLRTIRYLLEDWTHERATSWPKGQGPKNCGVTVYEYDDTLNRLVLREYNTVY